MFLRLKFLGHAGFEIILDGRRILLTHSSQATSQGKDQFGRDHYKRREVRKYLKITEV
jgi:hypothetical protein